MDPLLHEDVEAEEVSTELWLRRWRARVAYALAQDQNAALELC